MATPGTAKLFRPGPGSHDVTEAIDGFLLTRPDLVRLDGYPGIKVVARRALDHSKVAIISGGGAGHEPAHVGFVGDAMLSAAVVGDVFASPHVNAILAAMRHVTGPAGVLAVVKNYTGDRLAFALAAETLRSEGCTVAIVHVADDAAVDGGRVTGRRGLAGTLFVHKIAGAVAAAGAPLDRVREAAQAVAAAVCTMGASLTTCNVPGQPPSTRLAGGAMELGLGIHGEPGCDTLPAVPSADEVAERLVSQVLAHLGGLSATASCGAPASRRPIAVLVNNLGGLSGLEAGLLTRSIVRALQHRQSEWEIVRLYSGALMTALDMKGVSLSVLPLDGVVASVVSAAYASAAGHASPSSPVCALQQVLDALDTPAGHTAWPASAGGMPPPHPAASGAGAVAVPIMVGIVPVPPAPSLLLPPALAQTSSGSDAPSAPLSPAAFACMRTATLAACDALEAGRGELNRLDALAGDADCGDTMATMAAAVRRAVVLAALNRHDLAAVSAQASVSTHLAAIAAAIGDSCGGSSGVLYALMAAAAANGARASRRDSGLLLWADALQTALDVAMSNGGARAGDRTLLDALAPALDAMRAGALLDGNGVGVLPAIAAAAEAGALATRDMVPRAGRSAYVAFETLKGEQDPGAAAAAMWLRAVATALCG